MSADDGINDGDDDDDDDDDGAIVADVIVNCRENGKRTVHRALNSTQTPNDSHSHTTYHFLWQSNRQTSIWRIYYAFEKALVRADRKQHYNNRPKKNRTSQIGSNPMAAHIRIMPIIIPLV